MRICLGRNKNAISATGNRVRYHRFGAPVALHFTGIDEGHAKINPQSQGRDFVIVRAFAVAHPPGALPKRWDACAVGKGHRFHAENSQLSTFNSNHLFDIVSELRASERVPAAGRYRRSERVTRAKAGTIAKAER